MKLITRIHIKQMAIVLVFFLGSTLQAQSGKDNHREAEQREVKIFPNPATSVINILGLQNSSKASIVISDNYGNAVLNYNWEIKNNAVNIPIAHLEPGIYIISIRSPEQRVQKKFIKR